MRARDQPRTRSDCPRSDCPEGDIAARPTLRGLRSSDRSALREPVSATWRPHNASRDHSLGSAVRRFAAHSVVWRRSDATGTDSRRHTGENLPAITRIKRMVTRDRSFPCWLCCEPTNGNERTATRRCSWQTEAPDDQPRREMVAPAIAVSALRFATPCTSQTSAERP